jgi:hypothetical protein
VNKTGVRRGSPVTLAISSFPASCLHPSERGRRRADQPEERHRRAFARRRAIVEQPRCDTLSREPEPVKPYGWRRRALGPLPKLRRGRIRRRQAQVSPEAASFLMLGFLRFEDLFISLSIQFLLTLTRTISSYSCSRNSRSKQKPESP